MNGDFSDRGNKLRRLDKEKVMDNFIEYHEYEPKICKQFGCVRRLSLKEELFSDYCYKHQKYFANPETNFQ